MAIPVEPITARDPELRCAPWTRAHDVDPIGSTATFDALVLVEWPLPWPADVGDIPELAAAAAHPGVRVMTVVPRHDDGGDGLLRVVHHRRLGTNHLAGVDHRVPAGEVPALLQTLLEAPAAEHRDLPTMVGDAPPEVLVCGHGRRDPCCGRAGTLLHVELAARFTGVRVWRCSHTGGHRFAPTAITLPDGRSWAYADPDLLHDVIERRGDVARLARHDRGTSSLSPTAQVLDRALFQRFGWAWLDESVTDVEEEPLGSGAVQVSLWWATGSATGRVEVARTLPVLVCGEPPERATKSSPEYVLADLHIDDEVGRAPGVGR